MLISISNISTKRGSVSGSSTGAFVIPSRSITVKFKTSHVTTSTGSELAALRAAVEFVTQESPSRWAIFCDSKAALQCVRSLRRGNYHQMVYRINEICHRAADQGHDIVLQWLPGHCGISGNHLADDAARCAHDGAPTLLIPLSRVDAARELRHIAHNATLAHWNSPLNSNHRPKNLKSLLQKQLPSKISRRDATMLCRLWTGVAFTKSFSHRIGMADSSMCESCNCIETIEHLLCHCAQFDEDRRTLQCALNRLDDRPFNEAKILGAWSRSTSAQKATRALLRYLTATSLRDRL